MNNCYISNIIYIYISCIEETYSSCSKCPPSAATHKCMSFRLNVIIENWQDQREDPVLHIWVFNSI